MAVSENIRKRNRKKVIFLVNSSFDDLRAFDNEAQQAYNGPDLAEEYDHVLPGEGALESIAGGELMFYGIVIIDKTIYVAMTVHFHYRNDATRVMWSSPATPETNLPGPEVVTPLAEAAFKKAKARGEKCELWKHEFKLTNGQSTDDRHILVLYLPIKSLTSAEETVKRSIAAVS